MNQLLHKTSESLAPSCFAPTPSFMPRSAVAATQDIDPLYPQGSGRQASPLRTPLSAVEQAAECSQLFSGLCDGPAVAHPATAPDLPSGETEHTPLGKRALQVGKFASDGLRIPGAMQAAGKYGSEHPGFLSNLAPGLERAGAVGQQLLTRLLPKGAPQLVEHAKNALGYATQDPKTILKHLGGKARDFLSVPASGAQLADTALVSGEKAAAQALEKGAAKEGVSLGSRLLGKEAGKLVPGLNVAVAAGAAGLDIRDAVKNATKGNYVGATIDGLHAVTDGLGVIPGAGTLISLAGDALSIGAHWLTGR